MGRLVCTTTGKLATNTSVFPATLAGGDASRDGKLYELKVSTAFTKKKKKVSTASKA